MVYTLRKWLSLIILLNLVNLTLQSGHSPCSPSPCGVNTYCQVNSAGSVLCRCIDGYNHAPYSNSAEGCPLRIQKPTSPPDPCSKASCGLNAKCRSSGNRAVCECPSGYRGDALVRCTPDPCSLHPCGLDAQCQNRGSNAVCSCKQGYQGDPYVRCIRNPCNPDPCGINAQCSEQGSRGICSCPRGYTGDPYTRCNSDPCSIASCGHNANCVNKASTAVCSCPSGYSGNAYISCVYDPCSLVKCGSGAECVESGGAAVCRCPHGYLGDPYQSCRKDGCASNPCGVYAECHNEYGRPRCECPRGFQGDPYKRCIRGDCDENSDCGPRKTCKNYKCIDPCVTTCGAGADCVVRNHVATCTCPPDTTGDPFTHCRRLTRAEICAPCGQNTDCRVGPNNTPICSCKKYHFGDPLVGCRKECTTDSQCSSTHKCDITYRCVNACENKPCGIDAICKPINHRADCSCPTYYLGNPLVRCYAECTRHEDCNYRTACIELTCQDPCHVPNSPCGYGARCEVSNHKPICSCPKGFTGDPYQNCKREEPVDMCRPNPCGLNAVCRPGHDEYGVERPVCTCPGGYYGDALTRCSPGDCGSDSECSYDKACRDNFCVPACHNACAASALCKPINHVAVCSCPNNFSGDPLVYCRRNNH